MKKILALSLCIISLNLFAKELPSINEMKSHLNQSGLTKKADWKDEKEGNQVLKSMADVSGYLILLQPDQAGFFTVFADEPDEDVRKLRAMKLISNCKKMTTAIAGNLTDEQLDTVDGIMGASTKVPGYIVSRAINGYELNGLTSQLEDSVVFQCGVKSSTL